MHRELNLNKEKHISNPDSTMKDMVLKLGMSDFMKSNNPDIKDPIIHFLIIK